MKQRKGKHTKWPYTYITIEKATAKRLRDEAKRCGMLLWVYVTKIINDKLK